VSRFSAQGTRCQTCRQLPLLSSSCVSMNFILDTLRLTYRPRPRLQNYANCWFLCVSSAYQTLAGKGAGDDCILEIRRYKLILGYDTVPRFLSLYKAGLASKLNAQGTDPTTSLVTVMYSEVGRLNEVLEIWRHGAGARAMERSRVAARGAPEWRSAVAEIAGLAVDFTSTIHRPTSFSPLQ
jgi:hypothetical protein